MNENSVERAYQILNLMNEDVKNADPLYQPTKFWATRAQLVESGWREYGLENFRCKGYGVGMFVPSYGMKSYVPMDKGLNGVKEFVIDQFPDPNFYNKVSHYIEYSFSGEAEALADYRVLRAADSEIKPFLTVSESQVGNPRDQYCFDGKYYSRSMLNYLLGLCFLKKHCDTSKIESVMEIGGGYGTLGEILLGDERNNAFYINFDIPPTGAVSSYYLSEVLDKKRIGDYLDLKEAEEHNISELRAQYDVVNLPAWEIEKLTGSVDLFVNFISFQEMEPEVVSNYAKKVEAVNPTYILLRNIREGKRANNVDKQIFGEDYDSFFENYKLVATNVIPFGFRTMDNFNSELRLYTKK